MIFNSETEEGKAKIAKYPNMAKYTEFLRPMKRQLIGRKQELSMMGAALCKPEVSNVMLLASAGTGKTALVQGMRAIDKDRAYLEIDLPKMIADIKTSTNEMAEKLKALFREVETYIKEEENKEVVLFIDEFHQIVQLSPSAMEVLKPLLADSGTRNIKVIGATTYDEYMEFISGNQPLVERFQRLDLPEPPKQVVIQILHNMAEKYEVLDQIIDTSLFDAIYEYTNRYIPANAQPRKSILIFDTMIGWNRYMGRPLNRQLLADVIYQMEGVRVSFTVDAMTIKANLDKRVLDQTYATSELEKMLQICVADFNDKSKPMASFLFVGSTGVGKTETVKTLAEILFQDRNSFIRFDMSEYAHEDSIERFRKELTEDVWRRPYSVILIDEIEKAHPSLTRLLLQVLDDARLTDRNDREVSFKNSYVVLTTNVGSRVFDELSKRDDLTPERFAEESGALIRSQLQDASNAFPVELLGRIDAIVPFQPLKRETKIKICENKLLEFTNKVQEKYNISVKYDKDIIRFIVDDNVGQTADTGGAREVISKLNQTVVCTVARFINMNKTELSRIQTIKVDIEGKARFENKNSRLSSASLVVKVLEN